MPRFVTALVPCACALVSLAACSAAKPAAPPRVITVADIPVAFTSGAITLHGTLYLPDTPGRHPAIVLFHGSGPEPRNPFMGHWFAAQGLAALTYDKRGVGESTGDFRAGPFQDLAADGIAGVEWLKARKDVDPRQIGVWGLSQGGWLGPLAASRSRDIAFVIAVSGPGITPAEQMIFYDGNQLRAQGLTDAQVADASDTRRKLWHLFSAGQGYAEAKAALARARTQAWFPAFNEQSDGMYGASVSPPAVDDPAVRRRAWFRFEADYDPTIALRALSVPALFVFGEDDQLVPAERSAGIIRDTLTNAGHRDFTITTFPHADHGIMVTSPDGGRAFAPGYLATTAAWLRKHVT